MNGPAEEWLERARRVLVGGVDSTVRAFTRPRPLIVDGARGAYIHDAGLGWLLDNVLGYGPLVLGHAHPRVLEAVERQLERGWLYGATAPVEVELAEAITRHVHPSGMVRFVNSGTEATMLAIRLARAVTGRELVLKFNGNYHGAHDYVLVAAGSAASHLGVPSSPGVPRCVAERTLVAEYNVLETAVKAMRARGEDVAAIIVEPIAGNYGLIPGSRDFIRGLRELADTYGALLVFDEVITGFRVAMGGAQELYGVRADLVTLGKVIGGGFPIGAVVGPRRIMENLTPTGRVFNAGTFNGHPVAMAAGLATLRVLEEGALDRLHRAARAMAELAEEALDAAGAKYALNTVPGMLQFHIGIDRAETPGDVARADRGAYERLHAALLRRGVLIAPSQFEVVFASAAHGSRELEKWGEALREAAREAL